MEGLWKAGYVLQNAQSALASRQHQKIRIGSHREDLRLSWINRLLPCERVEPCKAWLGQLRQRCAPKTAAAQERLQSAEQAVPRESAQAKSQTLQTAISFGTTLLGAFIGRKAVSASTLGRATTAARGVGRTLKESQDISCAKETVAAIQEQLQRLDKELRTETAAIEERVNVASEPLETLTCKREENEHRRAARGARLGAVCRPSRRELHAGLVTRLTALSATPPGPGGVIVSV